MFGRITTLGAAALASAAFVGFSGVANAQPAAPACPDVHWIGAAGSGERTPTEVTQNGGMGRVVYTSLQELGADVAKDGRTMTAEAVDYPAVEVPGQDGGIGQWLGFMSSVDAGAAALGSQYEAFVQQCPTSKVVLAGYSQGAMVIHRNLAALQASPNLAAVLLVADGDRLPADPTYNLGTASGIPKHGKGVAQDWPILAHAPSPLTPAMGAKTISVCDLNDAVCDYDENSDDSKAAYAQRVAVHTSYAQTPGLTWTEPLHVLLGTATATSPAAPAPGTATEAHQVTPMTSATPTTPTP